MKVGKGRVDRSRPKISKEIKKIKITVKSRN